MALRLYNTLSRSLEDFRPVHPGRVGVYACGPTVYRAPHIGNFRTFVFNDVLHRYLEWKGYDVRFVMNLTDVEDKIIEAAAATGVSIGRVTEPQIAAFFTDLDRLGVLPADSYPRATEHIPLMVELVKALVERGHAYVRDGSVYFDISSFPDYGKLSRIELVETRAGAGLASRGAVDADEYDKEDARDFALWKASKDGDRNAGAVWPTPWGDGRPGWHIECSAMSMAELGETFDIHTGGEDLIFPHHEDEIAQSEGRTGKPFARYWLHVTHLKVNGEKMSKSKRNDFTVSQLLDMGNTASAMRFLLLQAHYGKELNFSFDGLRDAKTSVQRLVNLHRRLEETRPADDSPSSGLDTVAAAALRAFEEALDDDLNTPNAFGALFPFVSEVNAALDRHPRVATTDLAAARHALDRMDEVLGVISLAIAESQTVDVAFAEWVERVIAEREAARGRRDFAAADALRNELAAAGVVIEDTAAGPRWKRA
jgi:cysteinyl-tRNA synthetase